MTIMPSKANGLNSRQYRFCLNILQGMSNTDAYLNAGYQCSREIAYANASTLLSNPKIEKFLASYQEKQLAQVDSQLLSKSEKRQILATFARAQLIDLIDDNGQIKVNKKSPAAKALKEWYRKERYDRNGKPIVIHSLKMLDPIAAIMEDNKMTGVYAEKTKESSDNRVLNIIVVGGSDNLKNILAQVKERTKQLGMGDEE